MTAEPWSFDSSRQGWWGFSRHTMRSGQVLGFHLSKASSQPWLRFSALLCFLQQVKLEEFGRPKIDGELKVRSIVNHTKQDR